jgi:diguanylate cyclase (GGDEF)-like protein
MARRLRSRRSEPSELSFLVLDVDYFKGFNDRYGHASGDVALRRIANSIVESLHRELDVAARFGGEEFVVLLPETGAVAAQHVAERIRRGVEGMQITHGASKVYQAVTVSIGVAYVDRTTRIDQTTLFSIADHALYLAKEKRNCTVVVRYAPDDPALMAAVPRVLDAGE